MERTVSVQPSGLERIRARVLALLEVHVLRDIARVVFEYAVEARPWQWIPRLNLLLIEQSGILCLIPPDSTAPMVAFRKNDKGCVMVVCLTRKNFGKFCYAQVRGRPRACELCGDIVLDASCMRGSDSYGPRMYLCRHCMADPLALAWIGQPMDSKQIAKIMLQMKSPGYDSRTLLLEIDTAAAT